MEEPTHSGEMGSRSYDIKQLLVLKEEQNWCPSLDQEDQKPPQIKEEQEDSEITEFIYNPDPVKSEDEEEKPQLSELPSLPEENRDSASPESGDEKDSSETDVSDGNWEESGSAPSDSVGNNKVPLGDKVCEKDVQQVLVIREELLVEGKNLIPRSDQKPPKIKEEQKENEITGFTFSPVPVKGDNDEEKAQLSECPNAQTEGNGDSADLEPDDDDKTSNCSLETYVSDGNWEGSGAQSGLDSVKNVAFPIGDRKREKSKKLHICPDCGKTFRSRQGLLGHNRIHTGENPFSCSVCKKTFSSKGNLQKHTKVHTGERPFKCSICGAALKSKNALIEHTRTHTREKPFGCNLCGRSIGFRSYLTVHMKCHSEEKPHSCSVCLAAFKRKNTLLAHIKTHTGEKPYSCSVCGKNFAHCVSLTCHMRSHTGERPYSCSICQATFKWKNTFMNHIKIHTDK